MARSCMLALAVMMICVASGCMTLSAGVAPSTRPLEQDKYTVLNASSGTSWGILFLSFIPLKQANTAAALDEALRDRGADALVQVCVDNRQYWLLLFSLQRIKVEGLAVRGK